VLGFLGGLPGEFGVDAGCFFRPMGRQTYAGLVFCPHVNGPYGVVQQAEGLRRHFRTHVAVYSGEAPRNVEPDQWECEKRKVAHEFKRNQIAVMACTKAFGMGIDKPNIRYTVHIGLPSSIEAFYQEAGRAGRDRGRAECAIVLSNDDPRRSQDLLSPAKLVEEVAQVVEQAGWADFDDVLRVLWFHVQAFRGRRAEMQDIATMLDQLGEVRKHRQVTVTWREEPWSSTGRQRAEKALHRLVVLGVVADYTVDFASKDFGVRIAGASQEEIAAAFGRYAAAYQHRLGEQAEQEALALPRVPHREYVLAVAERLVDFIYEHIELARRRALNEMLQALMTSRTGENLRRRILVYLEQSEWDERLEKVCVSKHGGVDALMPILDDVVTPNDAAALRAATGRALASYPDIPGLLILRSVSEVLSSDTDPAVVAQNMEGALRFAVEKFRLDPAELAVGLGRAMARASSKAGAAELLLGCCLGSPYTNRAIVRALLPNVTRDLAGIPAWWLLSRVAIRCARLLDKLSGGDNGCGTTGRVP